MIDKYGKDNNITISNHVLMISKIDVGLVINAIVVPGFFYGFWIALCMRFDNAI